MFLTRKSKLTKDVAPIKINIGGIINSYCKTAKRPIYFIDSTISAYLKSLFFNNMALAPSFKEIKNARTNKLIEILYIIETPNRGKQTTILKKTTFIKYENFNDRFLFEEYVKFL
jgi:hypothetical protein